MTELIWEGKYDQDGRRVAPLRVSLPFQTIESVNESAQLRQRMLDLFNAGREPDWRNRLIWGDKKYVLPSLLDEFAGKVNLIYIDPPFNVGADFSFTARIPDYLESVDDGDETTSFLKEPNLIEQKAYRDTWGKGLDSYLHWFYETVVLLHELLADSGSIYIHLDWHAVHYAKLVMDEVFGYDNFRNEIIWKRATPIGGKVKSQMMPHDYDDILYYCKSSSAPYNNQLLPYSEQYINTYFTHIDKDGRRYRIQTLGDYSDESRERFRELGLIYTSRDGKEALIQYLDKSKGVLLDDIWTDIVGVQHKAFQKQSSSERVGFPTQKPEPLLERIINLSSTENDLVLDCFVGSGTTAAVAERVNRRWIACDLSRYAIHITRKRLLAIENVRPFVVQNLGKYERQAWQAIEFPSTGESVTQAYRNFILNLYRAQPITGYNWLHGIKGGRMVHVGSVDSPVTVSDITSMVTEFKRAIGMGKGAPETNGIDVLGWDFAFELNEVAKQQAALANVRLRFQRVPRDVMDKRAVEQGDIHFFELAALSIDVRVKQLAVTIKLNDFVIPPDDVPEDVQHSIKHWSQWIDYWAVDWDYEDDTFHNQWQTYRTRKNPELQKAISHTYDKPGDYTVVVKVIDILGNDTTKTLRVKAG